MDRLIHTALNSLSITRNEKINQAQNLANMNVPGFRRDLSNNGATSFLDAFDNRMKTRAFALETGPAGFSDEPGPVQQTGQKMDVAIVQRGYFYIMPENGEPALSRRGDFSRDQNGFLRDGAGNQMLDTNLQPIAIPPFLDIAVSDVGTISITTADGDPGVYVAVAELATVDPDPNVQLRKGLDGNIRTIGDTPLPQPNQLAQIAQGALEGSNVNPVGEMIEQMEMQREFEISMKLISNAQQIDEEGTRLMQAPE